MRELFPLQQRKSNTDCNETIRFKPLARIISSATRRTRCDATRRTPRFKPLARIISSATAAGAAGCFSYQGFKPLARIISSATTLDTKQLAGVVKFQTACANYFLCNVAQNSPDLQWYEVSNRLRELFPLQLFELASEGTTLTVVSNRLRELFPLQLAEQLVANFARDCFKPLARIISSATHARRKFAVPTRIVSNRLRELFPLQRRSSHWHRPCICVSNRLRELFPLQRKCTQPFSPWGERFQTACANYFLCNVGTWRCFDDRLDVSNRLRELFPLQHSNMSPRTFGMVKVSNRLRELFPLQLSSWQRFLSHH